MWKNSATNPTERVWAEMITPKRTAIRGPTLADTMKAFCTWLSRSFNKWTDEQSFKTNSKQLAEFQSPKSHQSLEKLRSYRGDAPEVGRFLLWFAALADSSITMFARRWINKNNHNIFLPTSCRSLCLSLDSVLPAIYVSLPLKTAIFALSSSPLPLSLSSSIAQP